MVQHTTTHSMIHVVFSSAYSSPTPAPPTPAWQPPSLSAFLHVLAGGSSGDGVQHVHALLPNLNNMVTNTIHDEEERSLCLAQLVRRACLMDLDMLQQMEDMADELVSNNHDRMSKALLDIVTLHIHRQNHIIKILNPSPIAMALSVQASQQLKPSAIVALGIVKEAEVARAQHITTPANVARIVRCLKSLCLVSKTPRKLVDTFAWRLAISTSSTTHTTITLPSTTLGTCIETQIPLSLIERVLADALTVIPNPITSNTTIRVPGSKSVSNRALLLAGVSDGACILKGLLHSDDTQVMMRALERLGAKFSWLDGGNAVRVEGNGGRFTSPGVHPLWMGNAGTATRFVISLCVLVADSSSCTRLHGSHRMLERPQGPLVDALHSNGCRIEYEGEKGSLPLKVWGGGFPGGEMTLAGSVSSQFVSSVLLAAPFARQALTLTLLEAKPTSISYIEMTLATMKEFGVVVERLAINKFRVPNNQRYHAPLQYYVEADASSATYPLALAGLTNSTVTVQGVGSQSLQGDAAFARLIMGEMGCHVSQTPDSTTVTGPQTGTRLNALPRVDMGDVTDAFLTASVVAAVSVGTTTITGIANQHVKECDRIAAMVKELGKCGVQCENQADGIVVHGCSVSSSVAVPPPIAVIDTYDDHRIAMSFAILGTCPLLNMQVAVQDKDCTDKTYPEFWDDVVNSLQQNVLAYPSRPHWFTRKWTEESIVIIGMRAAGKTSLGKVAAQLLGWTFVDLDDILVEWVRKQNTGEQSCADVVHRRGWPGFRQLELEVLTDSLTRFPTRHVLACGGGVVETVQARNILRQHYPILHIHRDLADIERTLAVPTTTTTTTTTDKRPKLDDTAARPMFGEPLQDVYKRRIVHFQSLAHFCFPCPRTLKGVESDANVANSRFTVFLENCRVLCTPAIQHHSEMMYQINISSLATLPDDELDCRGYTALHLHLGENIQPDDMIPILSHVKVFTSLPIVVSSDHAEVLCRAMQCGVEALVPPSSWDAPHRAMFMATLTRPVRVLNDMITHSYPIDQVGRLVTTSPSSNGGGGKHYYLFGHPIQQSPSPTMHNTAFALFGHTTHDRVYSLCDTADVQRVLAIIRSKSFAGASVTIPHKQSLYDVIDVVTDDAQRVGAVNTLIRLPDGRIGGDNTDWCGIYNTVQERFKMAAAAAADMVCNSNDVAIVIGAGGTARAACHAIRVMGLRLLVVNRTLEKAQELATAFGGEASNAVSSSTIQQGSRLVLVISTLPPTAQYLFQPAELLHTFKPVVLDAAYRPRNTPLLNQAMAAGCRIVQGIDMLVAQGLEQARIWQSGSLNVADRQTVMLDENKVKEIQRAVFEYYENA